MAKIIGIDKCVIDTYSDMGYEYKGQYKNTLIFTKNIDDIRIGLCFQYMDEKDDVSWFDATVNQDDILEINLKSGYFKYRVEFEQFLRLEQQFVLYCKACEKTKNNDR